MFSISSKAIYGIAALFDLAQRYDSGLVQIKDIVDRCGVPKNYLEQIFNRLTRQNIVRSVRGNKGGYQLAEHPQSITLLQVLQALEGELELSATATLQAVRQILNKSEQQLQQTLTVSLAELVHRQQQFENGDMYHI